MTEAAEAFTISWPPGWRAAATLAVLPEHPTVSVVGRRELIDLFSAFDVRQRERPDDARTGSFIVGRSDKERENVVDAALKFLGDHPEVAALHSDERTAGTAGTRVSHALRRHEVTLAPSAGTARDELAALCWLLVCVRRHDAPGTKDLRLPPVLTGLSRLLAALLRTEMNEELETLAHRWLRSDGPEDHHTWPVFHLQPPSLELLAQGRVGHADLLPRRHAIQLGRLLAACREHRRCTLEYASPNQARLARFEVDPWFVAMRGGRWFLIAASDLGLRKYRLERIVEVESQPMDTCRSVPDPDRALAVLAMEHVGSVDAVVEVANGTRPPRSARHRAGSTASYDVTTSPFALVAWACANPGAGVVRVPDQVRTRLASAFERILAIHQGAPSELLPDPEGFDRLRVDGVVAERQFAALLTVLAWDYDPATDLETNGHLPVELAAASLHLTDADAVSTVWGLFDELSAAAADHGGRGDRRLAAPALTSEERLMVGGMLHRARELPLSADAHAALAALERRVAPAIASADYLLGPPDVPAGGTARHGELLRDAAAADAAVTVTYRGRDAVEETAGFSPWTFAASRRDTYVRGHDHAAGTGRWLRLSRISAISFEPGVVAVRRESHHRPAPPSGIVAGRAHDYTVRLDPPAWWLLDELSPDVWPHDLTGGPIDVSFSSDAPAFVHRLVVRGAGHAELLSPPGERAEVAALAERGLAAHTPSGPAR